MRTVARISALALLVAGLSSLAASAAATTPKARDMAKSYLFTPAGTLTPLRAGVTYQASLFPIAVRLTPPDRSWAGTQWESGNDYFRGGGPPHFGWVHVGRLASPSAPSLGLVTIMTAYARTPSVATTVNVLRTRGHGATYEANLQVKLAGFSGIQFDGQRIATAAHTFVPFSPISHSAKYYPDEYQVYGSQFRVIVLDVRGKTVVVFIENVALPADQFPAFLTKAGQILNTLRFPR